MKQENINAQDGVLVHFNQQDYQELSARIDSAIRAGGSQAAYALLPIEQKVRQAFEQSQVKKEG
jgi:hypothetical protein